MDEGIGKVIWHSLNRLGETKFYDVRFGNRIIKNIPRNKLLSIKEAVHEHEERSER